MLEEKIKDFIKKQFEDLEDFTYDFDIEDNYVYINFTEIMGKDLKKEMAFKIIADQLQYHSISYGWKVLDRGTNIKYFWIDLLSE
jgi:hypothetical protein